MMSLTVRYKAVIWSQVHITPKFGKFGHLKRRAITLSVSKESMCSCCFSVSFNILLFTLLLIYVVVP